uniref:Expressed protein n=1 Tax=Echinococcus granulosus TaxID=6210 RepID=A0A068WMH7_ECHGR|nr:expressed protein [Echinococcus granulosus]
MTIDKCSSTSSTSLLISVLLHPIQSSSTIKPDFLLLTFCSDLGNPHSVYVNLFCKHQIIFATTFQVFINQASSRYPLHVVKDQIEGSATTDGNI